MSADLVRYQSIVFDSARWDGFEFRPGDIVISTPPKCGTTWTQMICALLVFQTSDLPETLDMLSPWLDMLTRSQDEVFEQLAAQTHRRFIKTHTPRDGLPWDPSVTYIVVGRDARDAACSWDNHMLNTDIGALFAAREKAVGLDDIADMLAGGPPEQPAEEADRFWAWVDDDEPVTERPTLHALLHHLSTWWDVRDARNVVMLHYSDLQSDLEGEMRRTAHRLGIEVPEERWPELVKAATFDEMRDRADVTAPDATHDIWQDNKRFFNRGTNGQWRRLVTDDDMPRYFARVSQFASPELSGWVHR